MTDSQGTFARVKLTSAHVSQNVLWLAAALAGLVGFYWTGLESLPGAWDRPEYSHGYLIPIIALYLLVREPNRPAVARGNVVGLVIVVLAIVVGFLGNVADIPDIITYGFIACVAGLLLAAQGTRGWMRTIVPAVYLIFMIPLPNFMYWLLSVKLQLFSSQIGVDVISALGIPVYLDGNIIDLGNYKLQVAEACSGLRYLFPLTSFSFLFAALYRGPFWHRLLIFLSAAPITVLMNSFRIAAIGVLVDRYGIEQAEGFLHAFEGWIIFIACVAILYGEAALLQRLRGRSAIPIHRMLDIDFSGFGRRWSELSAYNPPRSLTLAIGGLCVAAVAWQVTPARPAVHVVRDQLNAFPLQIAGWTGKSEQLEPDVERVLKASDYLVANYAAADQTVNLLVAYYDSQTHASGGMHSPQVCLPTGGWEVSRWTPFDTGVQTPVGQPLRVNRAIIQKGVSRQLVYYWFQQQGRSVASDYAAKAYTLVDSIERGRTDGALVRLVTPIDGEGVDASDARLRGFLGLILPTLPKYVPD
jgi:exosortase D (VPLPA-CTERM-specific)